MRRVAYFKIFALVGIASMLMDFQTAGTSYTVDITQSTVGWTGYYLFSFGEHYGSINLVNGQIVANGEQIISGTFDIDMNSIKDLDMPENDGGSDLSQHLKSTDFFDALQYPTAKLEIIQSKRIADAAPGGPNFDIVGFLTIKETKKEITFPAQVELTADKLTAKAKFKFDRTRWGIHYNSGKIFSDVGDGAISDAIAIEINLMAPNSKP